MKKIVILLLALLVMFSATACQDQTAEEQAAEEQAAEDTGSAIPENVKNGPQGDIQLLSCRFVDEIRSVDNEVVSMAYTQRDGRVYVDLRFSVNNQTSAPIGAEQITAWLSYDDVKQELQYCREGTSTSVDSEAVAPGTHNYVHLFTLLDAGAEGNAITVYYTVEGKEYECTVAEKRTVEPLTDKIEATPGKTINDNYADCQIKVLDISTVENLQASNQVNRYYPGPFVLVKVEITNQHPTQALNSLFAYVKINGLYSRINTDVETADGTDFESLTEIAPGEKETVYLYYKVRDEETRNDDLLRFNVAGSCYYVELP